MPSRSASRRVRLRLREAARAADRERGYVPPLVLRANAGECVAVELTNCLLGATKDGRACRRPPGQVVDDQESDANPDGSAGRSQKGLLPRIVPLNSQHLAPSRRVDIRPQLVTWDVTRADGVTTGRNPTVPSLGPGGRDDRFVWYAGLVEAVECSGTEPDRNVRGERVPGCRPSDAEGAFYHHSFRPIPSAPSRSPRSRT